MKFVLSLNLNLMSEPGNGLEGQGHLASSQSAHMDLYLTS